MKAMLERGACRNEKGERGMFFTLHIHKNDVKYLSRVNFVRRNKIVHSKSPTLVRTAARTRYYSSNNL